MELFIHLHKSVHDNCLRYLVFGQLDFDLVWLVGDLQLGVQSLLGFF